MRYTFRASPLQYIAYSILSAIALAIILSTFTSIEADSGLSILAAILLIQFVQALIQPMFYLIAKALGILGMLFVGLFGFTFVVWGVLEIVPGIENVDFIGSLVAAWIYAIVVVILQWVILAQSDDYLLEHTIKKAAKKPHKKTDIPGYVFVQLDGVSAPVFEWQLSAGNLPNAKKLIDKGAYTFSRWHTQLPSTTPASQAGILHGSHSGIPAFRWYERATDKIVVANQRSGAALIEKHISNGKGLLADGGISIGNLFSGDAPQNIMVMSKLDGDRKSLQTMREYTDYFSNPYGFMRAFILSIGEMIKEIYQAQHQRIKNIQPRVSRRGSYIFLRAGTNVLLRDLQTTIVVDQMMQGTNSIYVDYLDYDEIAHHAGTARPESLAALSGLDNVIGILTKATQHTPRPYHIVFVSDHGQSQGQTFKQLQNGQSLEELLGNLLGTSAVRASTDPVEQDSSARSLLAHESSGRGVTKSASRRIKKVFERKKQASTAVPTKGAEVVVTGSGNLGNIWLKLFSKRPTRGQIEEKYPGFISKLLHTDGVGLVIAMEDKKNPICIGQKGQINLSTEKVIGENPLIIYKNIRIKELYNLAINSNAPDLQVISTFNISTNEVHAFEELVGNHGGIGGWQTEAILIHPSLLPIAQKYYENNELYDSTTIHKIFIGWMKKSGHRRG